jgi:DnaJ-class molecular chaperone
MLSIPYWPLPVKSPPDGSLSAGVADDTLPCSHCQGHGADPWRETWERPRPCPVCRGSGLQQYLQLACDWCAGMEVVPTWDGEVVPCPECRPTGV